MLRLIKIIIALLFVVQPLFGAGQKVQDELMASGVTVDLRNPTYTDGVLTTCEGGVISGPDMCIQARCITYTKKVEQAIHTIDAEEDLILEFGDTVFVGERLTFDLNTQSGVLYEGAHGE